MNAHLPMLPVVLPLAAGALLLLVGSRLSLAARRGLSLAATLALLPVAGTLLLGAADGDYGVYAVGDWPAPFGIVLVVDRLAAAMLLVTALVAACAQLHASAGEDAAGPYFHALFQFQLLGINGAFLTGDLFNLFVFFEILLISSYTLLLHGLGAARVRAATQVVVLNLAGSSLFLFAVGLLYSVTGTLNLADLARVVPSLGADAAPLARSGALLLLVVFALKGAVLPLGFWLPQSYAAAGAAVAALFAVLTKVGVYAILRVYPLVFGPDAQELAGVAAPWLLPVALATLAFGALGVLASRGLRESAAWLVVFSVGTLLVAVGLFSTAGYAAAVYYMLHSTLVGAALFLLADLVATQRPAAGDRYDRLEPLRQPGLLGGLFMLCGIAIAGLPPLSGFFGKLMILRAAAAHPWATGVWTVLLAASLVVIVALARGGSALFWRPAALARAAAPPARLRSLVAVAALLGGAVALVIGGGPATGYAAAAARQLADRVPYVEAVLGPGALDGESRRARP